MPIVITARKIAENLQTVRCVSQVDKKTTTVNMMYLKINYTLKERKTDNNERETHK